MSATPIGDADFYSAQRVWDDIRTMREYLRRNELVVAIHPDDVGDGVRREIEAAPLVTLRESTLVQRGTIFIIRSGLLADLSEMADIHGPRTTLRDRRRQS